MFRGVKDVFQNLSLALRFRRTARAPPANAGAANAKLAELSKLTPAEMEARVKQLRASLIVSQQAAYQEQLNRVQQAAAAAQTTPKRQT